MIDIREIYEGEKIIIKLTEKNLLQLKNGKILEGFKTKIGVEFNDINKNGGK